MKKKRVLILGPISDYGGREVEVNVIAKSLLPNHEVDILSTCKISKHSSALEGIRQQINYDTLDAKIAKRFWLLNAVAYLIFIKNRLKGNKDEYVNSYFSKKKLGYYNKRLIVLKQLLITYDYVVLPVQLSTTLLDNIIVFCKNNNVKTIVRTTGTIHNVDTSSLSYLKFVDLFIHHSETNKNNLEKHLAHNYKIIDQCTLKESMLLDLVIEKSKPITFGFIGRLSEEKQILPLIKLFKKLKVRLVIAGDGEQKREVLSLINGNNLFNYLGLISNKEVKRFYDQIDVLIITSKEETGPLVAIEAMASGKLIISTNVGAMRTRLRTTNGFWIDKDLTDLEDVLHEILNMSEENIFHLRQKNRVIYKQFYSKKIIFNSYLEALSSIV